MGLKWKAPLDPEELKDYARDWAPELTPLADTISTFSFTLDAAAIAAGVTVDHSSATATAAVVWLKVLAPKTLGTYTLTHSITTVGGRTYEETITFVVKEK